MPVFAPKMESVQSAVQNVIRRYLSLPDEEKQRYLDMLGEIAGGALGASSGATLGAAAGGIGALPGAAVGAGVGAGGGRLLARRLGPFLGIKAQPESLPQELSETAKSMLLSATGESAARVLPRLAQAGKYEVTKWLHSFFKPTEEAKILGKLADKYQIPLNLAQRTGRPWLQHVELALDRSPFTVQRIREFRQEQYKRWQDALSSVLDKFHRGDISEEEFVRIADDALASMRRQFDARLKKGAEAAAKSLHPAPVGAVEAAEALKAGRIRNIAEVKKWADKTYGEIRKVLGKVPVDLSGIPDKVAKIGPEARALFDKEARMYLEAAESAQPKGLLEATLKGMGAKNLTELQSKLSPAAYDSIVSRLKEEGALGPPSITMPFEDVMKLRTSLLENLSRLTDRSHAQDVRAVNAVFREVEDSMEASAKAAVEAASDPAEKKSLERAYNLLKDTRAKYREFMEKLYPPRGEGGKGNIAAGILRSERQLPETIPPRVAKSPTLAEGVRAAASPSTVSGIADVSGAPEPMLPLRRQIFESTIRSAQVPETFRLSPSRLARKIPAAAPQIFGEAQSYLQGLAKPSFQARESLLYESPLARAIESGKASTLMYTAFPPKAPEVAKNALQFFGEAGIAPQARRAFADRLLALSRTQGKDIGDIRYFNPRTLERTLETYGETVPTVLGRQGVTDLGNLVTLGKGATAAESVLGNPSGTSRALESIRILGRAISPLSWPKLAAEAQAYALGAKAFTRPQESRRVAALLRPTPVPVPIEAGADLGAVTRTLLLAPRPQRKPAEDEWEEVQDGEWEYEQ